MRIANVTGRLAIIAAGGAVDVERASRGRFGPGLPPAYDRWDEFLAWGAAVDEAGAEALEPEVLGPPTPAPSQVFAIGLNYRGHARETGVPVPTTPLVFTKFPTCIVGPAATVAVPAGDVCVDWEVELVVVIGRQAHAVSEAVAWSYVAGVTAGQDLSERGLQYAGAPPQFSLGKSYPGFGPMGPVLVTADELTDPDDLALTCSVNGETVQDARTSDMVFSVAELIARLSAVVTLRPGDCIFTGTPSGVGFARQPPRFLAPGDVLVSRIEHIGELRQRIVAAS
jgi:2-keto-4-pentenoate hydratase/2-oxohepta-3-ene-1,7-dioic acid hydratase in catechol pathway